MKRSTCQGDLTAACRPASQARTSHGDAIIDHHFMALERAGDLIGDLESKLLARPAPSHLHQFRAGKRDFILMRPVVWPQREMVGFLARTEPRLIEECAGVYLRDVHDHAFPVADTLEDSRSALSGLQDLYLPGIGNRMNEVMKVPTTVSTLFVRLTFFAGVYGMNFKSMPELRWKWAYPAL